MRSLASVAAVLALFAAPALADDEADTPDVQIQDLEVETLVRDWIGQLNEKQRMVIQSRTRFSTSRS